MKNDVKQSLRIWYKMLQAQYYWSAGRKSEQKIERNVNNNQNKLNMSCHDQKTG